MIIQPNETTRPKHYEGTVQPWDLIVSQGLDFFAGNCVKYLCRHPKKNGKDDLYKAMTYLKFMIDNYEELYEKR